MRLVAVLLLLAAALSAQSLPIPTRLPATTCLPAGVTGPQLPACFDRANLRGALIAVYATAGAAVAVVVFRRLRHGRKR